MISTLYFIIATGFLAIVYGYVVGKQILSASTGNSKMQEIASAIQVGARAYLNRQYKTISIVGVIILVIITYALGVWVGIGYFIGAFLSGGVDSSLILSQLIKHKSDVDTFNIGFEFSNYDESEDANKVAKLFNTNHHKHRCH